MFGLTILSVFKNAIEPKLVVDKMRPGEEPCGV